VKPIYALCPHCAFPAVVSSSDKHFGRYCRQCRNKYVPALAMADQKSAEVIMDEHAQRNRFRLTNLVRRHRRVTPR
jgi:hypothetical protein